MAKTKTSKRKNTEEANDKKTAKKLKTNQNSSKNKSLQTSIHKFTVPASEVKRKSLISSKKFETLVKKKTFTGKQTKNWKVIHSSTQDYISECLETGVRIILSKATNEGHDVDDLQDLLSETVKGIKDQLKKLRAPIKSYGDIKKITQIQRTAAGESQNVANHEEILEEVVREEENTVQQYERELNRLQANSSEQTELHPFLCNFKEELHIPPVSYR
ncbi:Hypothetical predicted protein [Mytilus galloprovincialis]|uniref:Centromere protein Q n=1 Tax=Mytilus galloprovincialis TaxID=29158 RepID=A0A8B6F679_MYTGA|nr:Hypothetical predicted protein [Mytilus galloprovincialis]